MDVCADMRQQFAGREPSSFRATFLLFDTLTSTKSAFLHHIIQIYALEWPTKLPTSVVQHLFLSVMSDNLFVIRLVIELPIKDSDI